MRLGCLGLLMAVALAVPEAAAQETTLLDQAERLAAGGETQEARQALARWEREFGESAPPALRARAWFLAGRLSEEGAEAELHYLRVIIEGSSTEYADDALLRLAQYKYARGEYGRVVEYLGRLRRDYPTSGSARGAGRLPGSCADLHGAGSRVPGRSGRSGARWYAAQAGFRRLGAQRDGARSALPGPGGAGPHRG